MSWLDWFSGVIRCNPGQMTRNYLMKTSTLMSKILTSGFIPSHEMFSGRGMSDSWQDASSGVKVMLALILRLTVLLNTCEATLWVWSTKENIFDWSFFLTLKYDSIRFYLLCFWRFSWVKRLKPLWSFPSSQFRRASQRFSAHIWSSAPGGGEVTSLHLTPTVSLNQTTFTPSVTTRFLVHAL